jgi:hypothetical protein
MWLRDAWMASRAAAMAARPGLSTAAPVAVREDDRKGKRRKKKWAMWLLTGGSRWSAMHV